MSTTSEKDAAEKRKANIEFVRQCDFETIEAFKRVTGINDEMSRIVLEAIKLCRIPHVRVQYQGSES